MNKKEALYHLIQFYIQKNTKDLEPKLTESTLNEILIACKEISIDLEHHKKNTLQVLKTLEIENIIKNN